MGSTLRCFREPATKVRLKVFDLGDQARDLVGSVLRNPPERRLLGLAPLCDLWASALTWAAAVKLFGERNWPFSVPLRRPGRDRSRLGARAPADYRMPIEIAQWWKCRHRVNTDPLSPVEY